MGLLRGIPSSSSICILPWRGLQALQGCLPALQLQLDLLQLLLVIL